MISGLTRCEDIRNCFLYDRAKSSFADFYSRSTSSTASLCYRFRIWRLYSCGHLRVAVNASRMLRPTLPFFRACLPGKAGSINKRRFRPLLPLTPAGADSSETLMPMLLYNDTGYQS